jgi:hypothetical protein
MRTWQLIVSGGAAIASCGIARWTPAAEDPPAINVVLKNHAFSPAEIRVPAGMPAILRITNQDDTVEEFDSSALHVEKLIVAGHYAIVRLRPLGPGRYPFIGEYHADSAKGVVIAE